MLLAYCFVCLSALLRTPAGIEPLMVKIIQQRVYAALQKDSTPSDRPVDVAAETAVTAGAQRC
jgi:hypothetical protein